MIEFQQLKTFCAVVEKRSFTKAGDVVHRTQSTISTQILALEKLYGTTLLDRSGKEITLTENGKILYENAKKIIEMVENLQNKIEESKKEIKGNIVIGASTIPGTYILPKVMSGFKEKYPEVAVLMKIANSKEIINRILEHELEIGIVGEKINDKKLEYVDLVKDRIVLVAPHSHKWVRKANITLKDLREEKFISREDGSGTKATLEKILKTKGIKLNINVILESTEAVKEGIKAGLGLSFLSEWAIKDESLKEIKINGLEINRYFYLVFLKNSIKSRTTEAFLDYLKSEKGNVI